MHSHHMHFISIHDFDHIHMHLHSHNHTHFGCLHDFDHIHMHINEFNESIAMPSLLHAPPSSMPRTRSHIWGSKCKMSAPISNNIGSRQALRLEPELVPWTKVGYLYLVPHGSHQHSHVNFLLLILSILIKERSKEKYLISFQSSGHSPLFWFHLLVFW